MKQLFRFFLLLLALLLPALATAHDFEVDGIYYNINGNEATVTHYGSGLDHSHDYSGSVVIPAAVTYNGTTYPVTAIGYFAFKGCTGLTSIDIPNSVTRIDYNAFSGCSNLESVNIPNSVAYVGDNAFSNTAWYNNQPDGLVYAGSVAYKYKGTMPSGTSMTIKEGTLRISDYAFDYCAGLTSIVIPNSVTEIGEYAFSYCEGLSSIVIPNSVTKVGEYAFSNTAWYNNQPDGLVYAGSVAYKYKGTMPSGTSMTIKEGTIGISSSAFEYCTGLTSIVIPSSVTDIGAGAFAHCTDLTSVNIPNSVTVIGGGTFFRCTGLTSIDIPNSVTSIGNEAFCNCRGLTSIVIPNSVTEIAKDAFSYCSGLTSIVVESGNPRYDSPNDCNAIIETASNTLIVGCENTIIPNTVTKIGDYAFDGRTGLTDIVIPNSVTAIGFSAFADCTGLTSIDIPNSVTAIGNSAFYRCTGLTSIDIPNSVTKIGINAFTACTGLTSIVIPNSVTVIGQQAFAACTGLTSIVIPNSVTEIDYQAFAACTGLTDVYCYIADPSRVSSGYDPSCWWTLYDGDYSGRTLHVLQGMTGAYQADERWLPYFGQIVEDIFIGDVNHDLEVNIADVNAVIDIILGGNDDTIAADVNGDGEINIADINAVIDIILSGIGN